MIGRRTLWVLPVVSLVLFALTVPSFAEGSLFSGLADYGIFTRFVSSRAMGMGGAGLALRDSLSLNALNPAAFGDLARTRVSVGGYLSHHQMQDHYNVDAEDGGGFEFFALGIALKKGLGLGLTITPSSRFDYRYNWDIRIENVLLTQSRQGTGGLSRAALNLGWAFSSWGRIGTSAHIQWGEVEESRISYTDVSGYDPYIEFLNTKQWMALGGSVGILVSPFERLTLGAVFEPETPITLNREFAYSENDSTVNTEAEYKLAPLYGLGASVRLSANWLFSGQLIYSPWSELDESDLPPTTSGYQDAYELSGGAEWTPGDVKSDFLLARLQYRFGLRREISYVKSQGSSLDAYFATLGFGYPLHVGADRIDLSLEFGLRGDLSANGGQESIIRIHLGLNLGETWFVRPKPSWENE